MQYSLIERIEHGCHAFVKQNPGRPPMYVVVGEMEYQEFHDGRDLKEEPGYYYFGHLLKIVRVPAWSLLLIGSDALSPKQRGLKEWDWLVKEYLEDRRKEGRLSEEELLRRYEAFRQRQEEERAAIYGKKKN